MKKRGLGFTLSYKETERLYLHQRELTQKTFSLFKKNVDIAMDTTLTGLGLVSVEAVLKRNFYNCTEWPPIM